MGLVEPRDRAERLGEHPVLLRAAPERLGPWAGLPSVRLDLDRRLRVSSGCQDDLLMLESRRFRG